MCALHRLVFADAALSLAMSELSRAADRGLRTDNLFLHQTAAAHRPREEAADPTLGIPPDLPPASTQVPMKSAGNTGDPEGA